MTTAAESPTTIEKSIQLAAPRSRVWRALTTAREFSAWFGMRFDGEFSAGQPITGHMSSKTYGEVHFELVIGEITPETRFTYYWHPFALDQSLDYSSEPRTLVAFTLADADGGTLLTVVESGFEGVPASRRATAFEMNTKGWGGQMANIERYLAANA
jgi:uncharacterized protein YndB with AHSA1/START domain